MDEFRVSVEIVPATLRPDRSRAEGFIAARGLEPEGDVELTALVSYDGKLAACASLAGNVVKETAADPGLEGEGLAAAAVSAVVAEAFARGRTVLRAYTKPENLPFFASLGFVLLAESGSDAVLLENDPRAFGRWADSMRAALAEVPGGGGERRFGTGAVVVNCNPFTLGHLSLVKRAAARCAKLLVLVVEADKSGFPADVRLRLVREGIAGVPNAAAVPSGPYVISESTFPTYFLKEKSRATGIHVRLDLDLFARRVAPALGIRARFVGTEPFCPVTGLYNARMAELLPAAGVAVEELPRLEIEGTPVSASAVRAAIRAGDFAAARRLVPPSTASYLESPGAEPVIARIAAGSGRH